MSRKKENLSKVDIFYVKQNADKLTVNEIARDLNAPTELVQPIVDECPIKVEVDEHGEAFRPPTAYDLMGKKDKRAVIMTPAASMLGDDQRKKHTPIKLKDAIHKINEDR